jgi:hypothetical protein
MQREINNSSDSTAKTDPEARAAQAPATPAWGKDEQHRALSPAPPPVWTRYIDSRLKQFCTRYSQHGIGSSSLG